MNDKFDPKAQLLKDVLDSYKEEHRELSEIWRNLDAKSQGVIAIDGIFIAAMFAFIRALSESQTCDERWMLMISASLLTISVVLAIRVLWIRSVPSAPVGESLESLVDDLLKLEDGTQTERLHNLFKDHAEMWKSINSKVQEVNESKARLLVIAQGVLLAAILAIVLLTFLKIWS
jgi:type II secretory pathway predicted ATPase ExeA